MKNVYLIPTNPNDETKKGIWIKETRDWSNIYIISEEEIKEGDWCINTKRINEKINFPDKIIGKADYTANVLIGSSWKKIILTTDQDLINDGVQAIDEDFIEWFVNNPDCEWVDVDTRPKVSSPYEKGFVIDNPNYNKIIISKEEQKQHLIDIMKGDEELGLYDEQPKQESLTYTEAAKKEERIFNSSMSKKEPTMITDWLDEYGNPEIYKKVERELELKEAAEWFADDEPTCDYDEGIKTGKYQGFIEGAKWQQERSYSETEVKKLIIDFLFEKGIGREVENVEKWLEQNKKK